VRISICSLTLSVHDVTQTWNEKSQHALLSAISRHVSYASTRDFPGSGITRFTETQPRINLYFQFKLYNILGVSIQWPKSDNYFFSWHMQATVDDLSAVFFCCFPASVFVHPCCRDDFQRRRTDAAGLFTRQMTYPSSHLTDSSRTLTKKLEELFLANTTTNYNK